MTSVYNGKGLVNGRLSNGKASNTCYMLATLQALANVGTIREFAQYVGQHARGDDAVADTHTKCPRAVS